MCILSQIFWNMKLNVFVIIVLILRCLLRFSTWHFPIFYTLFLLLSEHISPEDVGRFAAICRTTCYIISTAGFWYSMYNRYFLSLICRELYRSDKVCELSFQTIFCWTGQCWYIRPVNIYSMHDFFWHVRFKILIIFYLQWVAVWVIFFQLSYEITIMHLVKQQTLFKVKYTLSYCTQNKL